MPLQGGPLLTDAALDQIARRWFAEIRAEQPKMLEGRPRVDTADGGTLLDWLFGSEDGDAAGDCSGD